MTLHLIALRFHIVLLNKLSRNYYARLKFKTKIQVCNI